MRAFLTVKIARLRGATGATLLVFNWSLLNLHQAHDYVSLGRLRHQILSFKSIPATKAPLGGWISNPQEKK